MRLTFEGRDAPGTSKGARPRVTRLVTSPASRTTDRRAVTLSTTIPTRRTVGVLRCAALRRDVRDVADVADADDDLVCLSRRFFSLRRLFACALATIGCTSEIWGENRRNVELTIVSTPPPCPPCTPLASLQSGQLIPTRNTIGAHDQNGTWNQAMGREGSV